MAEDYITPNQDPEYWDKHINGMILRDYSDYIRGSVLNVGCNHGAETILINRLSLVSRVDGIDINQEAIDIAKTRPLPHLSYFCHDITKPWLGIYDSIVCFHTLEHIMPEDLDTAIENLKDSLFVEGHILISVPYLNGYASEYHHSQFDETSLEALFSNWCRTMDCYRDQRVDWYGNKHDVINFLGKKI
jgi:SAM-dependent methyltransferase